MKRFLLVVLNLTVAISLTVLVFNIKFRIERRSWIITTAEITFVDKPEGIVYGTFTDCNGKVHSNHSMYLDGKFQKFLNISAKDPNPYLGNTVRIMYDPSTIALEEMNHTTTNKDGETVIWYWGIEIESYDNWLRRFIVSGIFFIASCIPLVVVCIKTIRKKKVKSTDNQYDMNSPPQMPNE